jgi:hypothetical protein
MEFQAEVLLACNAGVLSLQERVDTVRVETALEETTTPSGTSSTSPAPVRVTGS